MFYSFTKRFTAFSHIVLGFSLGIAPAAAWIAMRGSLDPRILWLTAAVTLWTAGFDMIYACQDYAFDVHSGLHSVPQRFGIAGALWIARLMHIGMLVCLIVLVRVFALGPIAMAGIAAVAGLLLWEHRLVKADDLSRIDAAFFTMNGYVSVIFFLFWATDIYLQMKPVFDDPRLSPIAEKVSRRSAPRFQRRRDALPLARYFGRRLDGEPGARASARR